jgi:hypothetical protein
MKGNISKCGKIPENFTGVLLLFEVGDCDSKVW